MAEKGIASKAAERRLDGMYKQGGLSGFVMLRIRGPGGQWKTSHLCILAEIAGHSGDGQLHFTTRGDVELHGVPFDKADPIIERLRQEGLATQGACGDSVRNVVACPGTGLCPHEVYDVGTLVREIAKTFTGVAVYERLPRKFKISVSGCERACALPHIQDLGLVACRTRGETDNRKTVFDMYLAGGLGRHPLLARKMLRVSGPEDALLFVHATLECFNEHGDRKRRHRARMKFLAERIGHEALLARIREREADHTWIYQM